MDGETEQNWEWFCLQLRSVLGGVNEQDEWGEYTFFSDRHPGLMNAIPSIFKGSHHGVCL